MRLVCCLLLSLAVAFPALAEPLDRSAAYELARAGEPDAIEAAFAAHQAAFNAGEFGPGAYRSPYVVFSTTEPRVEATLEGWLTAHPESSQAAAAEAARLFHIASLMRGTGYVAETPEGAMVQFRTKAEEARDLARRALEAEPRHLAAGHELMRIAAFLGARGDRDRGFRIVEELDTPANALLSGLQFNYARWGGSSDAIRRFCEERAPTVPDISVEECLALADYEQRDQYPERVEAAVATLSKGSDNHFLEQHIAALSRAGRAQKAYELAKSRGFMSYEFAYWLAHNYAGGMFHVEEFVAGRLRDDPLNPVDLAIHANALTQRGEQRVAREAFEKAMIYGVHNPFVRRTRIQAIALHPELRYDLMAEIADALEATDDDMEILGNALHHVKFPPERITHLGDGTPRPDFECTRLGILERHERACDAGSRHYTCQPGLVAQRDNIIIEARAKAVCGEATGRSWQDVVRYLLDLTE